MNMMKQIQRSKLCIHLISDLVPGSGQGWANLIDTDIVYDKLGFPYIPARRIKGVLKEAALELEQFNVIEKNISLNIFGDNEKQGHHFCLYNATLEHIDELHKECLNSEYSKFLNKYAILDYYTTVRYQTKIDDDGIADDNSLRSVRAIARENKFYSIIEYEKDDYDILKKCISNVTHMGMMRTRGFGEVKLSLIPLEEADNFKLCFEDNKEYDVSLYLENESALTVTSAEGKSLDYINGGSILGYFANEYLKNNETDATFYNLFVNGNIRFSNAYISDENWNQYYPVKESIFKQKVGDKYFDQCKRKNKEDANKSKVRNKFVTSDGFICEVEKEMVYHHRRPDDKSIGHVVSNEIDGMGMFYQTQTISPKQKFIAHIYGKGKDLKLILDNVDTYMQIGSSKYVQYGNVRIDHIICEEIQPRILNKGSEVVCTLLSPLVLLDNKNDSLVNAKSLNNVLPIEISDFFISYRKLGGYNAKWKLQKPSYTAFKEGSCIKGILTEDTKDSLVVGSLIQEGNGILQIQLIEEINDPKGIKYQTTIEEQCKLEKLRDVVIYSMKERMHLQLLKAIKNISKPIGLSASSVGRLLSMMQENKWGEFKKEVANIAEEDKKRKIEDILQEIIGICDEIYQKYGLVGKFYKKEFYLIACKEYFTKLKIDGRKE